MTCDALRRFVDALPLRERSDDELAAVRDHLEQCAACTEYVEHAHELEADLAAVEPMRDGADFVAGVMGRIEAETSPTDAAVPDVGELTRRALPLLVGAAMGGVVLAGALRLWLGPLRVDSSRVLRWMLEAVGGGLGGFTEGLDLGGIAAVPAGLADGLMGSFTAAGELMRTAMGWLDAVSLSPKSILPEVSLVAPQGWMLMVIVASMAAVGAGFWLYDDRHRLAERLRNG